MRAYTNEIRRQALSLYKTGKSVNRISKELGLNYKTVAEWVKRYKEFGESGLLPKYSNCGGRARVSEMIKSKAIEMKREHGEWGACYIKMKLGQKYESVYIPSERQIQRHFHAAGLIAPKTKLPRSDQGSGWSKIVFHRVQVDAKEQIQTQDGKWNSYLTFTDEYTGAVLEAIVFPL